jgi:hypothetical protein
MKDEREERMGTIMDHMTFTTIFSLLATVGMVLVIMWGMASGTFGERPVYRIRRMNRART